MQRKVKEFKTKERYHGILSKTFASVMESRPILERFDEQIRQVTGQPQDAAFSSTSTKVDAAARKIFHFLKDNDVLSGTPLSAQSPFHRDHPAPVGTDQWPYAGALDVAFAGTESYIARKNAAAVKAAARLQAVNARRVLALARDAARRAAEQATQACDAARAALDAAVNPVDVADLHATLQQHVNQVAATTTDFQTAQAALDQVPAPPPVVPEVIPAMDDAEAEPDAGSAHDFAEGKISMIACLFAG